MHVNGGKQGVKLIVVDTVFLALSFVAVSLRLWARRLRQTKLQLNDWLLLIALVFQVGQSLVSDFDAAFGGTALPSGKSNASTAAWTDALNLPGSLFWGLPLLFIKLSVLHFYYTIFVGSRFRLSCLIMMGIVTLYFVVYVMIIIFTCIPIQRQWDKKIPGGCIDVQLRVLITAILNLVIDVVIVALPMPVVWGLQMPFSKRLAISGIFGAGLLVCLTSGLRIHYMQSSTIEANVNKSITTLLEPDLGSVVACLPLLQPVLYKVAQRMPWLRLRSGASTPNQEKAAFGTEKRLLREDNASDEVPAVNITTASQRLFRHYGHNIPESAPDRNSAGNLEGMVGPEPLEPAATRRWRIEKNLI